LNVRRVPLSGSQSRLTTDFSGALPIVNIGGAELVNLRLQGLHRRLVVVVLQGLDEGVHELLGGEVAQGDDGNALGALGIQRLRRSRDLLRQVEADGIDLEEGPLAHPGAIDHRVASADFCLVVELDAGDLERCQRGQGTHQQQHGQHSFHRRSPRVNDGRHDTADAVMLSLPSMPRRPP
jgi:hypothetical protein